MPLSPDADIEISAFSWLPPFAQGVARDMRVRWALEEAGLPYRARLLDARLPKEADYYVEQPFGQVPIYDDGEVRLFESGAIVLHIAQSVAALMPRDPQGRARAATWVFAAINSIEPPITELNGILLFNPEADWAKERLPAVEARVRERLARLADWLGDKDFLEDRFTAGDLVMATVLRFLRHTDLVAEQPTLAAYLARCEDRPAFRLALADHQAGLAQARAPEPA